VPTRDRPDIARELALANRLADAARGIALGYFRRKLAVETKADLTPVTAADREIESELRRLIHGEFPRHGIHGEEFGDESGSGYTWVLDPIDGTKSFITGLPLFGTLIALLYGERPILGLIDIPALGERWLGHTGAPTLFNGQAVRTSACTQIGEARVYTTSTDEFTDEERHRFDAVTRHAFLRRFGGDCYAYGLLASGHCDLIIDAGLKPHDFLPMVPVITGAGGRISSWNGAPLGPHSDGRVVAAANDALLARAIEALATPA
jgi:inositol-phosphate phosphatase/L-galactose 1-phosphate phosphatase/histidinol-phosphatase